jgi:hypothetical protein
MDADEMYRAPALPEDFGEEGEREIGSDWFVWSPTIGPASPLHPGSRSTKDVMRSLDPGGAPLASRLCWRVSGRSGR